MSALSETSICNMALGRIGATTLSDLGADDSPEAIQCNLHYEQTRDALLRSHWWRFASARATLSELATTPSFEWDSQFKLPNDFLRMKNIFADNNTPNTSYTRPFALEGKLLLINESKVQIRYIKQVIDVAQFDSLFTEVLVLTMALKLVMPLTQDTATRTDIRDELARLLRVVRTVDRQETNTSGRAVQGTWLESRLTRGSDPSKRGGA